MKGIWITVLLVLATVSVLPARAAEQERRVLALYDSSEPVANSPDRNFIHKLLEMPLNHLGLAVDYQDVNGGSLPDVSDYRAVILWFTDDKMKKPDEYCRWLGKAIKSGTRVVAIGGLGAAKDEAGKETGPEALEKVYGAMGLRRAPRIGFTDNPFAITYEDQKPDRFGFETDLPPGQPVYDCVRAVGEDVEVWRSISRTDVEDSRGIAVAVGSWGGFILDESWIVRSFSEPSYHVHWDLDPFEFLEAALHCETMLRPDVTTRFGARVAYSHIDGDGMVNMSRDVPGGSRTSAEVVLDEVLREYPIPVTVGLIVGRLDPDALGSTENLELARRILKMPTVQPGCHGYAHPLNWTEGKPALEISGYEFDLETETVGAMRYLEQEVLPEDEKVQVYQWTGDCEPPASALAFCEEAGVPTINGEDSRYDAAHESVSFIAPLTRPVGGYRQVNASACNEYIYTERLTENFGGFRNVIETFRRTDSPRRLLPVNVYYHFYSGERLASLNALQEVYDWCLARQLCWIHAGEYARSVRDFHRARIGRMDEGGYWVEDYGQCRTVRLANCERQVDMSLSTNVIGFNHHNGDLYVSLKAAERATIKLCAHQPLRPCIALSTSVLRAVNADKRQWRAEARLYAPGQLRLRGFPPGETVTGTAGDRAIETHVDSDGVVAIDLPSGTGEWMEVSVAY